MNLTNQILKNDVQILIFCLTYIITTAVHGNAPKIYVSTFIRQRRHLLEFRQTKGQLISKGLLGVFDSSKKRTKTSRPEVS